MARLLIVIGLIFCVGSSYAALTPCEPGCTDGSGPHQCPPLCPNCSCTTHAAPSSLPTAPPVVAAVEPPLVRVGVAAPVPVPPSPDPQELLHVPRSSR